MNSQIWFSAGMYANPLCAKSKFKKGRFCKQNDVKRFMRFTLQPKSADDQYFGILKNKINKVTRVYTYDTIFIRQFLR
jgi:hypothetical protein